MQTARTTQIATSTARRIKVSIETTQASGALYTMHSAAARERKSLVCIWMARHGSRRELTLDTVDYYRRLSGQNGGMDQVQRWSCLFVVPSMPTAGAEGNTR